MLIGETAQMETRQKTENRQNDEKKKEKGNSSRVVLRAC